MTTDEKTEGRTSVLATLTKSVMAEKSTAARALTPVAGEVANSLPRTQQMFPNDMPGEVIEQKVADLTRIIGHLTEARDALSGLVDAPVLTDVVDLDAARKAKEREADEKAAADFNADFEAKKQAAQAAVHGEDVAVAQVDAGWVCPEHGRAVMKTSTKTNRTYIGCPDCNQFKR